MQQRFASVNSFGLSSRWSDGYTSMPFVSEASRLAYCPGCNKTYWLEDATNLGVVPSFEAAPVRRPGWLPEFLRKSSSDSKQEPVAQFEQRDLDYVDYHQHPRPADVLLAVLRQEWSDFERELYLRTRLWWLGNHSQRGQRMVSPMSGEQSFDNMIRLLALHQAAADLDQHAEVIAELLRQMGQFDEAIAALRGLRDKSVKAAMIADAAERGESLVFEVETF